MSVENHMHSVCMVHGVWYMVHGVWYMVYGVWHMVYYMVHGLSQ